MRGKNIVRGGLTLGVFTALLLFFLFHGSDFLTLEFLKEQKTNLTALYENHPAEVILVYSAIYVISTALSIPGAAVLTLAGGAIFGLALGTVLVSFASTFGATLAFLFSRFLFRDFVQSRFRSRLQAVNKGFEREGALYLFTLRLIPVFPFFAVNLLMSLTPIRTLPFFWVSQIGMLPGTLAYVNAGTQLAKIQNLRQILSPEILASFAFLGLLPWVSKSIVYLARARRVQSRFRKPRTFDYNLVVIGAGAGGLVGAYVAAALKAKVALIEKDKMGGECLNTGCVPSKALIRTAKFLADTKRSQEFGIKSAHTEFDFAEIMNRVQRVIQKVAPHDSVERYAQLGVHCIHGSAEVLSPYEVSVGGKKLTTRSILIATGSTPFVPSIPGLEKIRKWTSDSVWQMQTLPKRLLVVGAGPVGCELSQCFRRFGSEVTLIEKEPRILARHDEAASNFIMKKFQEEGIRILNSCEALSFGTSADGFWAEISTSQKKARLEFDEVLLGLGRRPRTEGFGLENLRLETHPNGTLATNPLMETSVPGIYACGDVAGPFQLTHTASDQGAKAAVNALFRPWMRLRVESEVVPFAVFTDPEIASVGLSQSEAIEKGIPYSVFRYDVSDLDRAITDGEEQGFVQVLTSPGSDQVLGAVCVCPHAGELVSEFAIAMKNKIGLKKILSTLHTYPTYMEANRFVAGTWRRSITSEKTMLTIAKFHRWRLRAWI